LSRAASDALNIAWEYWDGKVWRGFLSTMPSCLDSTDPRLDGTSGLTASGTIVLKADCASAQQVEVNGIQGFWLRGRLTDPLPPDPGKALPDVDSIRLSTTVDQALRASLTFSAPYAGPVFAGEFASPPPTQAFLAGIVKNEAGQPVQGAIVSVTNPDDAAFGTLSSLPTGADGAYSMPVGVPGGVKYQYAVVVAGLQAAKRVDVAPIVAAPRIDLTVTIAGIKPDQVFADTTKVDLSKPFYPLGQIPQPGSVFYVSNADLLSKPARRGGSTFRARIHRRMRRR
jgi:hypothetical protein